jgi:hypothetical protein
MEKRSPSSGFGCVFFLARIPNNEIINGRNHVFLAGKPRPGIIASSYARSLRTDLDDLSKTERKNGAGTKGIRVNAIACRQKSSCSESSKMHPPLTLVSVYERRPATVIRASV